MLTIGSLYLKKWATKKGWYTVNNKTRGCVKIIAVCSFYISPRSKFKHETVQHFIETIHMMRAKYDDKIHILLAGDANKFPITPVLNSYGQLRQICSIPTRKNATLELIITDLWGLYHPPSSMPPLKVDQDKKGKDSDHAIIISHRNQMKNFT